MNHRRKRPRRKVRCRLCTDNRYGNSLKGANKQALIAAAKQKEARA